MLDFIFFALLIFGRLCFIVVAVIAGVFLYNLGRQMWLDHKRDVAYERNADSIGYRKSSLPIGHLTNLKETEAGIEATGVLYDQTQDWPTTSANFGESIIVKMIYADGSHTLHGIFYSEEGAEAWADQRMEEDSDEAYKDSELLCLNMVGVWIK